MRWATVPFLITLLSVPAIADEALGVRTGELRAYAYRNSFGETEHYLVVGYEVSNPTSRSAVNRVRTTMLTAEGHHLNDGYRPLVLSAFCRELPCEDEHLASTAEVHGRRLEPGKSFSVLALFRVPGELPEAVRLRVGETPEVSYRRVDGPAYARVETSLPRSPLPATKPASAEADVTLPVEIRGPEGASAPRHLAARPALPLFP